MGTAFAPTYDSLVISNIKNTIVYCCRIYLMPILRNTLENWKIYFVNSFIFWTTPEKDLLKVHRILMNYMTQGNSI